MILGGSLSFVFFSNRIFPFLLQAVFFSNHFFAISRNNRFPMCNDGDFAAATDRGAFTLALCCMLGSCPGSVCGE